MIAAWMLYCTAVAFLMGAAAAACERGGRLAGWATRWIWTGAMTATLGLPLLARSRPAAFETIQIPWVSPTTVSSVTPSGAASLPLVPAAYVDFSWADLDRPLVLLWAALSLGLLAFGVAGMLRLRRLRRGWRAATVDGTSVLVSAGLGPAVVGVVRARLVIPAWTLELDAGQRALMLTHEREHLRAGDPRLLAITATLLVLMPWNLGLWWQWRRLQLAVEMDCDARVLRRHPDRERYGRLLLEVSRRAAHSPLPVAAFHEPMSLLERRIRSITAVRPKRLLLQAIGTGAAAALLIVAACEAPRPVEPEARLTAAPGPAAGPGAGRYSASVTGAGSSTVGGFGVDVVGLAERTIEKEFGHLLERYRGTQTRLWFIADADGNVVQQGVAPGVSNTVTTTEAARIVPGYDTLSWYSVTLLGPGRLRPESPPVVWIQLRSSGIVAVALPRAGEARPAGDASGVETRPALLSGPAPLYPPLLNLAGIGGVVMVEAILDTTGGVDPGSVRVVHSSNPGFNAAAMDAIRLSRWLPGRANGRAVRMLIRQSFAFSPGTRRALRVGSSPER